MALTAVLAPAQDLLIRFATVHPVSGPDAENASVLVLDGRIVEIGVKIVPPKGKNIRIVDAKGLHVYPGMIDSGAQVGLAEIASVTESNDVGEIGDFNPQLRALIAINPESEHIPVTRANGITAAAVFPAQSGGRGGGGGGLIGGQISLIHLDGWTWEQMEIRRSAALQLRFPAVSGRSFGFSSEAVPGRESSYQQARQNKDAEVKKLKNFFEEARRYKAARDAKDPSFRTDVRLEAMLPVLDGKLPVVVMAVREREIREAIGFADEQRIRIILAGVRRPGRQLEEIAKRRIPVILGTTLAAPLEEDDPYDAAYTLPAELHKAGVKFAFGSFGVQFARNLPYEAAMGVAFGLPAAEGLKSVTLNAAGIWGLDAEYGSLEKGKVANLVVADGDLLEARTQVKMMFIKGAPVDLESKHTRLYKKYLARP
jgi:imidazolonepropionase-like amidohydrolase